MMTTMTNRMIPPPAAPAIIPREAPFTEPEIGSITGENECNLFAVIQIIN